MEFFSKEELIAAASKPQLPCEPVELTINGVTKSVWVQGMSGKERDSWERSLFVGKGKRRDINTENVRAKLAVRCLVNKPGGHRLFEDSEAIIVGNLPAAVLTPIYEKAQRLSGVSDEDIEEIKKFSETADGSDSPSHSPLVSVG